jgi:hypothetical protein
VQAHGLEQRRRVVAGEHAQVERGLALGRDHVRADPALEQGERGGAANDGRVQRVARDHLRRGLELRRVVAAEVEHGLRRVVLRAGQPGEEQAGGLVHAHGRAPLTRFENEPGEQDLPGEGTNRG